MGKRYQDEYEKRNVNKSVKSGNNKKKKKKHSIFKTIFVTIFVIGILCCVAFAGMVFGVLNGAERLEESDLRYNNLTTFVYDKYGNEYATLYGEENRVLISLNDMSPYLPKAFVAIEDERFETHFGVDIQRTLYAIYTWVKNGGSSSFGGSTITQQLVKNITNDRDDDPLRKVREWVRAVQVESWLSKDEILEMYLNIIYLGSGSYGVQAASYTYFGKDARELTLAESAVLAGINHGPESYNRHKNPEKIKARQETVLAKMLELGTITQEEYDEAVAQELVYQTVQVNSSSSYIVEAVIEDVIADIIEQKKTTKAVATKMIYGDGLKIYTNIDPDIQAYMEEIYADESYFPLDKKYNETPQSAMIVIDYQNGGIVGLVGGAGDKVLRGLNRATQSKLQPGSTIKPIAVYGPGIDKKIITAATVYDDLPMKIDKWNVNNWTGGYAGLSTVRQGIEKSMNVVAVKALQDVGIQTAFTYLQKLGVKSIVESDKALPLALGGVSGITPLEMCGAYAAIANKGEYIEPTLYTKVLDKNNKEIIVKQQEKRQVFSQETAYIVTDMMRDVVRGAEGTATYVKVGGNPVAAKTGSTDENKDRWFCAFTPYYVGTVWYGFDDPKRVNASGQNPAAKIWTAVMTKVHKDLEVKQFEKPSTLVQADICEVSGKLAGELCSQDQRGSMVRNELFIKGTVPTDTCDIHVTAEICGGSGLLAGEFCPSEDRTSAVFIQRTVLLDNVMEAADYKYEIPKMYCDIHTALEPIIPGEDEENNPDDPTQTQQPDEDNDEEDEDNQGDEETNESGNRPDEEPPVDTSGNGYI